MEAVNGAVKTMSYTQAFRLGLITQLSNPKIAIILARYFYCVITKRNSNLFLCGVADAASLLMQVGIRLLRWHCLRKNHAVYI